MIKTLGDKKPGLNLKEHKQDLKDQIPININGNIEDISVFEYARWLCLVEGIVEIDKFVEKTGREFDCKPIPLLTYIDERTPAMIKDVRIAECI